MWSLVLNSRKQLKRNEEPEQISSKREKSTEKSLQKS